MEANSPFPRNLLACSVELGTQRRCRCDLSRRGCNGRRNNAGTCAARRLHTSQSPGSRNRFGHPAQRLLGHYLGVKSCESN